MDDIETRKAEARKRFPILKFFEWHHLPPDLQLVSQGFADVAWDMALRATSHPAELAAGLRKLLEAKDCAVRAALPSGDQVAPTHKPTEGMPTSGMG